MNLAMRSGLAAAVLAGALLGATAFADPLGDARAAHERGDDAAAAKILSAEAEAGNAKAQFWLGVAYERGAGVDRSDAEAMRWYLKSAAGGNSAAAGKLGYFFSEGRGAARSYPQALEWYQRAVAGSDGDGEHLAVSWSNLGDLYFWGRGTPKDAAKARSCYEKAAALGNPVAQNNLAYLYEHGLGGARDAARALEWYRKAAEQGLPPAEGNVGVMYDGRGPRRDPVEAVKWFRRGADRGDARALFMLGRAYERGRGVGKDLVEACKWYRLAAAAGSAPAAENAERLKRRLSPADWAEAVKRADARAAGHE